MRKTFILFILLLFVMPTAAFAHSSVKSAAPAKDSTVQESPTEVEMTFSTKIESLSTFKLYNSAGDQMEIGKPDASGSILKADIADTLPNDTYTVKWTAVGADGHAVEGDYSFTVAAIVESASPSPVPSAETEATKQPSGSPSASSSPSAVPTDNDGDEATGGSAGEDSNSDSGSSSNVAPLIIIGAMIIVLAAVVYFMRRRQR